ncbi:MAG TPA: TPM domain-containing protein, partial [Gemmatimonadales bacterium]
MLRLPHRRALSAVIALLCAAPATSSAQPALDSVVPPSPAPDGFIHDGGPVLDDAARARLNARITDVQRATGGDVAVAIVPDIRGRAPAEVGVAIYRAWGVGRVDSLGSARRNLGALLLIVPKELAPSGRGECWITSGIGAEGELVDADAGTICRREVIPHLREQRYEEAVAAGVDAIAAAFVETTEGLDAPRAVGAAARDGGVDGSVVAAWLLGGGAALGG